MPPPKKTPSPVQDGFYAVLGMDLVGFSLLPDEEQIVAIKALYRWMESSLEDCGLKKDKCPWSPGGDGGHITFPTAASSRKALDVAFGILERAAKYNRETGKNYDVRLGIHLGSGSEAPEFRDGTNFWGHGINTAARITAIAGPGQVLISQEYHSALEESHKSGYRFSEVPHKRTVKHGKVLTLYNVHKEAGGVCVRGLDSHRAHADRWHVVGSVWQATRRNYEFLTGDALEGNDVVAALASAKCLLDLGGSEAVNPYLERISPPKPQPRSQHYHPFFSPLPVPSLFRWLRDASLHPLPAEQDLFAEGKESDAVYFLVSGLVRLSSSHTRNVLLLEPGAIIGETALWLSGVGRTGTITAHTECLFLKISYERYREFIRENRNLEQNIAQTIKDRTLGNALKFEDFFPALSEMRLDQLHHELADLCHDSPVCEKFSANSELDLQDKTYLLHSGEVHLSPPSLNAESIVVSANGHFDRLNVVGVFSHGNKPIDGKTARVVRESLAICIPHPVLMQLFTESSEIGKAWDLIWGLRKAAIDRRRNQANRNLN